MFPCFTFGRISLSGWVGENVFTFTLTPLSNLKIDNGVTVCFAFNDVSNTLVDNGGVRRPSLVADESEAALSLKNKHHCFSLHCFF
jgi:hypothetical protein